MHSLTSAVSDNERILPQVIIWDPYISGLVSTCVCIQCNGSIERKAWKTGQSTADEPRLLHCIDSVIVLVSCKYVCSSGHSYLTTDPRLLELISSECIPFILMHKIGFTKSLLTKVINLVKEGLCISAIERFITTQRRATETSLSVQLRDYSSSDTGSICEALSLLVKPYPSNDAICKCFLSEYLLNQKRYNFAMSRIESQSLISFDHTFKVAANIGYLRDDGKWITQYNSVMIIMNEDGLVMGWQFTKTTRMDEVKELFMNVGRRVKDLEELVIIADNCCTIKGKLVEVFGSGVCVKLDLFHAVQRITKKLPKQHPMVRLCTNDLRLVFRQSTDIGHVRMKPTASCQTILANIDQFVSKWQLCEMDGWKMMNDAALKECESIKTHVRKGCLSDLPVGAGTNRNERLHRYLRPHFSHTRLGLLMALSMMTITLHHYNCQLLEKRGEVQMPIQSLPDVGTDFQFGIVDKHIMQQRMGSTCGKPSCNLSGLISDLSDICEMTELSSCVAGIASIEDVIKILEKALYLTTLTKSLPSAAMLHVFCEQPIF